MEHGGRRTHQVYGTLIQVSNRVVICVVPFWALVFLFHGFYLTSSHSLLKITVFYFNLFPKAIVVPILKKLDSFAFSGFTARRKHLDGRKCCRYLQIAHEGKGGMAKMEVNNYFAETK